MSRTVNSFTSLWVRMRKNALDGWAAQSRWRRRRRRRKRKGKFTLLNIATFLFSTSFVACCVWHVLGKYDAPKVSNGVRDVFLSSTSDETTLVLCNVYMDHTLGDHQEGLLNIGERANNTMATISASYAATMAKPTFSIIIGTEPPCTWTIHLGRRRDAVRIPEI